MIATWPSYILYKHSFDLLVKIYYSGIYVYSVMEKKKWYKVTLFKR